MYIADLHIHSRYSRATSKDCIPEFLDLWARKKGIDVIGTGDFTHPAWRAELKEKLEPAEEGLYILKKEVRLREGVSGEKATRFVVTGEISSIYKKNGRVRKVHNLILLPSLEAAETLALKLESIGNIHSDGRPILGLDSRDLLEIMLDTCPEGVFVPAHIWTPHFSMFGAFSGFQTVEECFEDLTPYIRALETGLSSDPLMNWRLSALDSYCLISNSDAHSPAKLGREANLLDTELSYPALSAAITGGKRAGLKGTIEFFPEEGKYHYDGHRNCDICLKPAESLEYGGICPVCGKKLTIGVEHQVEQLADRPEGFVPEDAAAFESLVPLPEVIAASTLKSPASVKVAAQYEDMLRKLGNEFYILRKAPLEEIGRVAGPCIEEGIRRLRNGRVERQPGFDGRYGVIRLLTEKEVDELNGQISIFMDTQVTPTASGKKRKPIKKESTGLKEEPSKGDKTEADSFEGFNRQQTEALISPNRVTRVIAGPGTGKTGTLTGRIAWLLEERGVRPFCITAVTFTNKAAGQMRDRLKRHFGGTRGLRSIQIGTFHSICLKLLERLGLEINLLDEPEALAFAEQVIEKQKLSLSPTRFLREISACKNGKPLSEEVPAEAFSEYELLLKEQEVLDFDDLLRKTLEVWEETEGLKEREQFRHLLVDEFQDLNDIQYRLICMWNREGESLFVIGDPDQAVYGFRGADSRCFDRLLEDMGEKAVTTVRLVENYRSTPEILSCALPVISAGKTPRPLSANRPSGIPPRLVTVHSDLSEGIFIAKEINKKMGGVDMLDVHDSRFQTEGRIVREFSDFAVLYRTHRQAGIIEKCLTKEGIPYTVTGREDYLCDESVRDVVGFFRFLLHGEEAARRMGKDKRISDEWLKRAEEYMPLIRKENPLKLLERWIADKGLRESEPLAKLLHTSVLYKNVPDFLNALLLGQEGDITRCSGKRYTSGAVRLMTLHAAKGLEFPVVFLCGVKKGCIPFEASERETDWEEERRLFYVGMTRAKEELIVLTAGEKSKFLADIPEGLASMEEASRGTKPQEKQMSLFDFL